MEVVRSTASLLILTALLATTFCSYNDLKEDDIGRMNLIEYIQRGYKNKEYLDTLSKTNDITESESKQDMEANDKDTKQDLDAAAGVIPSVLIPVVHDSDGRPNLNILVPIDFVRNIIYINGRRATFEDGQEEIQETLDTVSLHLNVTCSENDYLDRYQISVNGRKVIFGGGREKLNRLKKLEERKNALVDRVMKGLKAEMEALTTYLTSGAEGAKCVKLGIQGVKQWLNLLEEVVDIGI